MSTVLENINIVREQLENACIRAGRDVNEVTLMGVTKYVDTGRIGEALDAGIRCVGENHAQEFREKLTFYKQRDVELHFIGQLQTNKVKYLIGEADFIDSIDRFELAEAVSKKAASLGVTQKVLIEVNIGEEPQKGGVLPEELPAFFDRCLNAGFIEPHGLMCVPPAGADARPYFRRMRTLFEGLRKSYPDLPLDTLSMGMSADYPVAVEEGATHIRVGSAIFGARGRK